MIQTDYHFTSKIETLKKLTANSDDNELGDSVEKVKDFEGENMDDPEGKKDEKMEDKDHVSD